MLVVQRLPKTRSGKILRLVVRRMVDGKPVLQLDSGFALPADRVTEIVSGDAAGTL